MNFLELFAGSRSLGKIAKEKGHNVFSIDWTNYENIDLVIDIGKLKISDIPFVPDVIWASPDCTTYSLCACGHHRNIDRSAKTEYAKQCDEINVHWIGLLKQWQIANPDLIFFIENPRAILRKMNFMLGIPRTTITYCSYGIEEIAMKPTDIFSNHIYNPLFQKNGWKPKSMCWNNNKNCHHESAPRGSKTGTQGKKNSFDRSKIPQKLCEDIIESTNSVFEKKLSNGAK